MILGIETSSEQCAAALVDNGRCMEERSEPGQRRQSAKLLPLIDDMLKTAGVTGSQLEGLAVSQGPGSFTGLRVGMSLAKGLALGWQKPLVGVRTLLVLAHQALQGGLSFIVHPSSLILALMDAKRGEVYVEWFEQRGDEVVSLRAGTCQSPEAVKQEWEDRQRGGVGAPSIHRSGGPVSPRGRSGAEGVRHLTLIGDGLAVLPETWKTFSKATMAPREWWAPRASTVARVAEKAIRSAAFPSFTELSPLYLREPAVTRPPSLPSER